MVKRVFWLQLDGAFKRSGGRIEVKELVAAAPKPEMNLSGVGVFLENRLKHFLCGCVVARVKAFHGGTQLCGIVQCKRRDAVRSASLEWGWNRNAKQRGSE